MVYEETSGLYYDYNTGYYYDSERKLYYDGNTGTWYGYSYEENKYVVHSTAAETEESKGKKKKKKDKKKKKKRRRHSESSSQDSDDKDMEVVLDNQPRAGGYPAEFPPALRIVVTEIIKRKKPEGEEAGGKEDPATSGSPEIASDSNVGTLFVVTCKGGTIGREGNHDVLIQDIGCSKFHGKIEFK